MGSATSVDAARPDIATAHVVPRGIREVTLRRSASETLGIDIKVTNLDVGVVSTVSGIAAASGRVFVGDRIVCVNGMKFLPYRGMLETAGNRVKLQLCNEWVQSATVGLLVATPVEWDPDVHQDDDIEEIALPEDRAATSRRVMIDRASDSSKIGFNLAPDGMTIERVWPGSRAARSGMIFAGDRLMAVDGRLCYPHTTESLLKAASTRVMLEIASPVHRMSTPQRAVRVAQVDTDSWGPLINARGLPVSLNQYGSI